MEALELRVWRSGDWKHGRAKGAAEACGCAARAARHPLSSAKDAICCERYAIGIERGEYSRNWLWSVLDRSRTLEQGPVCGAQRGLARRMRL